MNYNKQKLKEGLHELMKLKVNQLEEAIGKTELGTIQTKEVYGAVKSYLDAEKIASPIIDTLSYRSKCGWAIFEGFERIDLPSEISYLNKKIKDLDFTIRVKKALNMVGLSPDSEISELVKKSGEELYQIKTFGKTCLREVRRKLRDVNLSLREEQNAQ